MLGAQLGAAPAKAGVVGSQAFNLGNQRQNGCRVGGGYESPVRLAVICSEVSEYSELLTLRHYAINRLNPRPGCCCLTKPLQFSVIAHLYLTPAAVSAA